MGVESRKQVGGCKKLAVGKGQLAKGSCQLAVGKTELIKQQNREIRHGKWIIKGSN
jgi:hypothetical protein